MRKLLAVLTLVTLVGGLSLVPRRAEAAEHQLGTIIVQDAGCVHNLFPVDGGAFSIPALALITVQPDQNAYVCVDELSSTRAPTCSTTNASGTIRGVYVPANTAFPSSCDPQKPHLMADGGLVFSCAVTVCASGVTSLNAPIWRRQGNEF